MTQNTNTVRGSNILITGGAGFVGSYLIEALFSLEPHKIYVLDDLSRGSLRNIQTHLKDSRVEFVEGDVSDMSVVNACMSKVDYCFHMAAMRINACAEDPARAFEVMLRGTFNVIEAAKQHNIKKIVYSSSASVYGQAKHLPTSEEEPPYDNQTFYGAAKLYGEQMLRSYEYMYGLKSVSLRYFNIYGPRMDREGRYTEVLIKWLDCVNRAEDLVIYGDGKTSMDFVYVTDVASANVRALQHPVSGEVFNIGSGTETSLNTLAERLKSVTASTQQVVHKHQKVANPVARRCADISKAQRTLEYTPQVSLEEGLGHLVQWYRESGAK